MSSFSKAVIPYCFPEISPSSMSDAVTTATKGGARLEVPFVPGAKTDGLGERIWARRYPPISWIQIQIRI